jgi:hypothetical protein
VALPAWLAVMEQLPVVTSVSVLPLTVQTAGVLEAKLTGRLELAVAESAGGAVPRVRLPGLLKEITWACGAFDTVMATVTAGAAAVVALPAWLALMEQVPAVTKASVLPLTVHTLGVLDVKLTARPEVATADSAGVDVPMT